MNPWDIACRHYLEQAGVNMSDHHAVDEAQRQAWEAWQRGVPLHEYRLRDARCTGCGGTPETGHIPDCARSSVRRPLSPAVAMRMLERRYAR